MAQILPVGGQKAFQKNAAITINLPDVPLYVPDEVRQILNSYVLDTMRLALQDVAGHISDEAPRDTGTLGASFGADPATSTGGIELMGQDTMAGISGRVFSSLPYAIVMDEGRRKGAPINRAGIDAIGLWAQRKLGLSSEQANEAKWAIASSIVAKGIAGTGYFDKGVKSAEPRVQGMFNLLGAEITNALLTKTGKKRNVNLGKFVNRVKR